MGGALLGQVFENIMYKILRSLAFGAATAEPVRCYFLNLMLFEAEILSEFSVRLCQLISYLEYARI